MNVVNQFLGTMFLIFANMAMIVFTGCGVILLLGFLDWCIDTDIKQGLARKFGKKSLLRRAKNASNRILEGLEKAGQDAARRGRE